jgi:transcriptional regulator with XRE-family HTH domain
MTPTTPAERVAAEVRAALARQGKRQRYAAEVLGISQQAMSRRMNGEIPFDVAELHKLADALAVPVETFMAGAA